jgi:hypothetical protein
MGFSMDANLTITTTATPLYTFLVALNPNAPRNCTKIEITGDDGQTANVFIGSYGLTDTNYSFKLVNGGDIFSDGSQSDLNSVSLTNIFLKVAAAGGTQPVHCRVRVF